MTYDECIAYCDRCLPRYEARNGSWDEIDGWGVREYNLWADGADAWYVWGVGRDEKRLMPNKRVEDLVAEARRALLVLALTGGASG